jgi:hypothetical protein
MNLLYKNHLLNENESPISLMEIKIHNIPSDTVLYSVLKLFHEFKKNSKTKISTDISEESLFFISCIGGLNLNTVKNRSSNDEAKIARLIISKHT